MSLMYIRYENEGFVHCVCQTMSVSGFVKCVGVTDLCHLQSCHVLCIVCVTVVQQCQCQVALRQRQSQCQHHLTVST